MLHTRLLDLSPTNACTCMYKYVDTEKGQLPCWLSRGQQVSLRGESEESIVNWQENIASQGIQPGFETQ